MKRHLNLMSRRSRVHANARIQLRLWGKVLVAVTGLLVPTWFLLWWPVQQAGQHVATLDAKFEPLREMNRAGKGFQKNIERVRAQEKTALALAKIDTPVVTLLGIVGQAVADNHGRVVVENLDFQQAAAVLSEDKPVQGTNPQTFIKVEGRGIDELSVNQLANDLRSALPFADVQIKSSERDQIHRQQMQKFTIQCSF